MSYRRIDDKNTFFCILMHSIMPGIIIIMRSSSLTESHLIRVRVGFHSVALQAKFSCELALELRVQGSTSLST